MRLSVATNFDNKLLDQISSYPVEDIYGKLTRDFIGGGRASYTTGGINKKILEDHIKHAHKLGIKFNYLLNSVCMGNREWTKRGVKKIRRFLDWLGKIGVDSVTVSIPYLAEIIKKRYPHFLLKIGIFSNIDSSSRARFWENLGADMLTLESFSINRNFQILEEIRGAVKCGLQLIANFTCIPNCPMQIYHMVGLSHGSNSSDNAPFIDYCILKCSYYLLKDPVMLIKSNWIRPEDIRYYESIEYINFKILERNAPTEVMVSRVKAYSNRTSPDNLLELIQPYGFTKEIKKEFGWSLLGRPRLMLDLQRLIKKRGMLYPLKDNPVYLDSKKIPSDFLERISERSYCDAIAGESYRIDEDYKKECMDLYNRVFNKLCS